jgi:hypothetical protein
VLDRESTFANPDIVNLLQTHFVPVAIDQANQRRQKDTEGIFYRKIASQSPRNDFQQTTQGFYAADAGGNLLFYNNNRDPQKLLRLLRNSLREFEASDASKVGQVAPLETTSLDGRYQQQPPENGLVVRVRAKVLGGYKPTENKWRKIFQNAVSRDNLWISAEEQTQLCEGEFPRSLQMRLARFHLVDNTRGEPPMWRENEIRELDMQLKDGELRGTALMQTASGERGYRAELRGNVTVQNDRVVQFDLVSLGEFWGEGRFTRGAPEGEFPLAVTFTLADGSDIADSVAPQGARGWLAGYCPDCAQ